MKRFILCMAAALVFAGAAGGRGAEEEGSAGAGGGSLDFPMLQDDAESLRGETVVIAGKIDAVAFDGTEIRMRLHPLPFDELDVPEDGADTGCFIAVGEVTIDPRRLHTGEDVAVVGVVEGREEGAPPCPVIRITQLEVMERPGWEGSIARQLPRPGGARPPGRWGTPFPWYYRQPSYPYPLFNPNHPPAFHPVIPFHGVVPSANLPPIADVVPGSGG